MASLNRLGFAYKDWPFLMDRRSSSGQRSGMPSRTLDASKEEVEEAEEPIQYQWRSQDNGFGVASVPERGSGTEARFGDFDLGAEPQPILESGRG